MLMVPVVIAQNNNLHDFFTIFISGVTGIPTGLSLHRLPKINNTPWIRLVHPVSPHNQQDKIVIPFLKYGYQKLMDAIIRVDFCHSF